jgi:hypothetical protein
MPAWKGVAESDTATNGKAARPPIPTLIDLRDELGRQRAELQRHQANLDRQKAAVETLGETIAYYACREEFGRAFERAVERIAKARGGASKLGVVTLLTDALDATATGTDQS